MIALFHHKKTRLMLFSVVIVGLLLTSVGCTGSPVSSSDDSEQIVIVTSFLPMYIFTANLIQGIDGVTVVNLAPSETGCLHNYHLLPSDLILLDRADIFVYNGAGMEIFLEDLAEQRLDLKMVEASSGVALIQNEDGSDNPHVWLSIPRAMLQVENISLGLQAAFPGIAGEIETNEAEYMLRLQALHQNYVQAMAAAEIRDIVTFHEAFPYLADEYGLTIAAVIELEPGSEPSAAELADTIDMIRQLGITALFTEPQYSASVAEAIARETSAIIYTLDPVVTGQLDPDLYIETMEQNLEVLKTALKSSVP